MDAATFETPVSRAPQDEVGGERQKIRIIQDEANGGFCRHRPRSALPPARIARAAHRLSAARRADMVPGRRASAGLVHAGGRAGPVVFADRSTAGDSRYGNKPRL